MYVDYRYYTDEYLVGMQPKIDEASFPYLEKKAEVIIDKNTRGQYLNITDLDKVNKIKDCICAIVESLNEEQMIANSGVRLKSESVGGHSVSYDTRTSGQYEVERQRLIRMYLWSVGICVSRKVYGYEG